MFGSILHYHYDSLLRLSPWNHFGVHGPSFSKNHCCWKQWMLCFRDIRPLCVGTTPVPKGFPLKFNFSFCFQFSSLVQFSFQFPISQQGWGSRDQFFKKHQFFKITVAESNNIFLRHTAFVCGGNPCSEGLLSHVQFYHMSNFSFSSQFTSRGTRHPWPTVCNEATVLDGISGLITLTYLQLVTMFFHYPSFLLTFRLLFFIICMNNSRNRSPLRIFQYLPISATFVQCGQRRPSWTKHVNSRISSGILLGMKRLIDEIQSFKCVCICYAKHVSKN